MLFLRRERLGYLKDRYKITDIFAFHGLGIYTKDTGSRGIYAKDKPIRADGSQTAYLLAHKALKEKRRSM